MPSDWASRPSTPQLNLSPSEVHVWRAGLDLDAAELEKLQKVLSPDEEARAERFHFEKDQRRFIASRGILRRILSRYFNREPARLQFSYSRFGKPSLAPDDSGSGVHFNLSHSHGLALYAVGRFPEIGVDVERLRRDFPCEQIAEHFFSPHEVKTLRSLPEAGKYEAFFNCWTRKEAFVKARGEGLSLPFDQFTVSLAPAEPVALLRTEGDYGEASQWALRGIDPADGYIAALAVAVKGNEWHPKFCLWPSKNPIEEPHCS